MLCLFIRGTQMVIRTYSELITIPTFLDRFEYLRLNGKVGEETFGYYRYLNQVFYRSSEWKKIRNLVIIRDNGCDLGLSGYDIHGKVYIHHMNPITVDDIRSRSEFLLNPDYLICVSHMTHEAITYGDKSLLLLEPMERTKNDTCPWRR